MLTTSMCAFSCILTTLLRPPMITSAMGGCSSGGGGGGGGGRGGLEFVPLTPKVAPGGSRNPGDTVALPDIAAAYPGIVWWSLRSKPWQGRADLALGLDLYGGRISLTRWLTSLLILSSYGSIKGSEGSKDRPGLVSNRRSGRECPGLSVLGPGVVLTART